MSRLLRAATCVAMKLELPLTLRSFSSTRSTFSWSWSWIGDWRASWSRVEAV